MHTKHIWNTVYSEHLLQYILELFMPFHTYNQFCTGLNDCKLFKYDKKKYLPNVKLPTDHVSKSKTEANIFLYSVIYLFYDFIHKTNMPFKWKS